MDVTESVGIYHRAKPVHLLKQLIFAYIVFTVFYKYIWVNKAKKNKL